MDEALGKLLQNPRVWRGRDAAAGWQGLQSGYRQLDRHLPGGGWPPNALTEILLAHYGSGELKLLMPAMARLCREPSASAPAGWIAWIGPPFQPYPPALVQWGIDLSRVLVVRPRQAEEALWAAEQALSSGNCAAVLLWSDALDVKTGRRLQLAAEKGRSWAVAFRRLDALSEPSAAALRIRLGVGRQGTELSILKSRGGRPTILDNLLLNLSHHPA